MFKTLTLSKHNTNPKCPPSIRRLPNHLLRLVGVKRNVVKSYILVSSSLLPALADVGAAQLEGAGATAGAVETNASAEEE